MMRCAARAARASNGPNHLGLRAPLQSDETLIETVAFAKLVSLNSPHFDFSACNFTEKNMCVLSSPCGKCGLSPNTVALIASGCGSTRNRKDRREGLSKSGSGRVSTYRLTGLCVPTRLCLLFV